MTNKIIRYDPHASSRLRERGFRRADVRWLLAEGEPDPGYVVSRKQDLKAKRGYLRRTQEARVLYTESATEIYIITVMWIESRR